MDVTDEQARAITNWAAEERVIQEVRLFGERSPLGIRPQESGDSGVRFGPKPKLSAHQIHEIKQRKEAGESCASCSVLRSECKHSRLG